MKRLPLDVPASSLMTQKTVRMSPRSAKLNQLSSWPLKRTTGLPPNVPGAFVT